MVFYSGLHDRTLNLDVSQLTLTVVDYKNNFQRNYSIGAAGLIARDFDMRRQFLIYVPGFTSQFYGYPTIWVLEAMRTVPDVYYVFIDYSAYSKVKLTIENLQGLIPYVYYIGTAVGELLADNRFVPTNMHLVGHSVGAHIAGNIANTYTARTGDKIRRFTAIDPSAPCFKDALAQEKTIKSGAAEYVDVLHCTNTEIATDTIKGDTDHFFNWNYAVQPGCYDGISLGDLGVIGAEACGHYYCVLYWANTVVNKDLYKECGLFDMCNGVCKIPQICGYHRPCKPGNFYVNTLV